LQSEFVWRRVEQHLETEVPGYEAWMNALVLESAENLSIRDMPGPGPCGPDDVRVRIHTVGICGSDVHYYTHGRIGPFVVREPMILGHEASGTVIECGDRVQSLNVGDRVCMDPGLPNMSSRATREGMYNVDPEAPLA
jgi:D-xylulose reductase